MKLAALDQAPERRGAWSSMWKRRRPTHVARDRCDEGCRNQRRLPTRSEDCTRAPTAARHLPSPHDGAAFL